MAVAAAFVIAWAVWMWTVPLRVLEVSSSAHLEVEQAARPIQSPANGVVTRVLVELDQRVDAGQLLFELDAESLRLRLAEQRAELDGLASQARALSAQLQAQAQAHEHRRGSTRLAAAEARANADEAEALAVQAEAEAARTQKLLGQGSVSEAESTGARIKARSARAHAEALALKVERLALEQKGQQSDELASEEALHQRAAAIEGSRATLQAAISRQEHELQARQLRAPVQGRIGELMPLGPGSVVREGDRLGSIVPEGTLRAVAEFTPQAALGRVRPGQPARLRLTGFPWTQYGSIPGVVTTVASEARLGTIRVELSVAPPPGSPIPLQHGLPGTVEIEVDRAPGAELALRAVGRELTSSAGVEPR